MAEIVERGNNTMFEHRIGEHVYSFTVKDFNPIVRQWLREVVGRQMDEIHARATRAAREDVQKKVRDALGV